MKATIVDLRYRMKDVLRAIDRGESVTVLYRGKERARIVPVRSTDEDQTVESQEFFGMWKDRTDMAHPAAYVRKIRWPRFTKTPKRG